MVFKLLGQILDYRQEARLAKSMGYEKYEGFFIGPCGLWRGYFDPATCSIEHGHALNGTSEALNGYGTFYNAYDGMSYKGEWRNNVLSSGILDGVKILRNQDLYVGRLENGLPDGPGKIWYGYQDRAMPSQLWGDKNASYFEGYFQQGMFHGRGSFQWHFGVSYTGDFVEGKRHGTFVFTIPDEVVLELHFKNDKLQGYKVVSPATHPLRANRFKTGKPHRDSYHEHYLIGDPDGYCLKLSTDGFVPSYFYMGEAKNGDGHGKGLRMYFSRHNIVLERGEFAKSALFGRGHDQNVWYGSNWSAVPPTHFVKMTVEEGEFFDGKLKDSGRKTESFIRPEAEFKLSS